MDVLYDFFKLIFVGTQAMLIFGIAPVVNASIIPAIPLILGMITLSGKGKFLGNFLGFTLSYAITQIVLGYIINFGGISYQILQKIGLMFLVLFGLMMLFPKYALWNRQEEGYEKAKCYGIVFGFIWAFWAAVPKSENILMFPLLVFFMLVAVSVPGLLFILIEFVLSPLYSKKYIRYIEKGIGGLTLLISFLLFFEILKTPNNS